MHIYIHTYIIMASQYKTTDKQNTKTTESKITHIYFVRNSEKRNTQNSDLERMNGMWLYLKENVKCGTKLSDVICLPRKSSISSEDNLLDKQAVHHHPISTPIRELIFRQNITQTWLYELENRDPSRKIVEMIFQKAWTNPTRPEQTIKSVLKVKNSVQSLERFEQYREKAKTATAFDGNELLRFYGTTMACRGERSKRASALCKDYGCRVCRILQSNFGVEYCLDGRIRLSSRSEDFNENDAIPRRNIERAVIVCRTIAESSVSVNKSGGNVVICNPSAVLPCFVIVFN